VRTDEAQGRRLLYLSELRIQVAMHCHGCCATGQAITREQRARHDGVIERLDGTVAYGPI